MMGIRLTVNQADIDNGVRGDIFHCPIAKSIWRAHPKVDSVAVTTVFVSIVEGEAVHRYQLSPRAAQFILSVDGGLAVQPSTFKLQELTS